MRLYLKWLNFLFIIQLLLVVGCLQSEVVTTKVNPSSISGFDSSNPVPVFTYASTTNSYSMGTPYILIPSVSYAGYGLSFSLAGTLPAGLSFDTYTGAISGIPTAAPVSPSFTITATNNFGSAYKSILLVTGAIFSYPLTTYDYSIGSPFTAITPTITYPAAAAVGFSVSPSLPAGLTLNPVTGTIAGTPTASSLTTAYNISATVNGLMTSISISLHVASAPNISYTGTNYYVRGTVFSLSPTEVYRGNAFAYSTPSGTLPAGFTFNTSTGVISGTASAGGSGNTSFVVRTANSYGLVDHTISFVEVGPPVFSSTTVAGTFQRSSAFSLDIESGLTFPAASNVTYVSSPALPNVNCLLSLNTSTGVISGTVASTAAANACVASYTITAMNTADPLSRTSAITLTLNETGPPQVGYPLTSTTYQNALPFTLTPTYYYLGTLSTPTAYTIALGVYRQD